MESNQILDRLSLQDDKSILKLIKKETLLYSDKLIKVNRYGASQERNLLITDKAIYNLKKNSKFNFHNDVYRFKTTYCNGNCIGYNC